MKTGQPAGKSALPIICERVHYYREKLGMEQKALAHEIGVTANAVSNWENGRSRPDVNLLPGLCDALGISLYDLFGLENPAVRFTKRQQRLAEQYALLRTGHQFAVDQLIGALLKAEEMESRPDIRQLTYFRKSLAAGIGDPTEFEAGGEPIYVYPSPEINKADCVFGVNGNSMEPEFHSGDLVLVKRISAGGELHYGDIGAFIVGNETYIKEYEEDGLHSLNPSYPTMHFADEQSVYLIGRVIGVLNPKSIASAEEVEKYEAICGRPQFSGDGAGQEKES